MTSLAFHPFSLPHITRTSRCLKVCTVFALASPLLACYGHFSERQDDLDIRHQTALPSSRGKSRHLPCKSHGTRKLFEQAAYCIYRAFGGLLSVDVSGTNITDDGLQMILGSSKCLRSLSLRDLPGLTDRGLAAVLQCIKRRRQLHDLQLCRSLRFSDDGQ